MSKAAIKFDEVDTNGLVTVKQVAKKLGFSTSKVYKLIESKLLRAHTVTDSRRQTKRIEPRDVIEYVRVNFSENFSRGR